MFFDGNLVLPALGNDDHLGLGKSASFDPDDGGLSRLEYNLL
jgi:hypothetical protein